MPSWAQPFFKSMAIRFPEQWIHVMKYTLRKPSKSRLIIDLTAFHGYSYKLLSGTGIPVIR